MFFGEGKTTRLIKAIFVSRRTCFLQGVVINVLNYHSYFGGGGRAIILHMCGRNSANKMMHGMLSEKKCNKVAYMVFINCYMRQCITYNWMHFNHSFWLEKKTTLKMVCSLNNVFNW